MNWQRDIAEKMVLPIYQQMDGLVCFLLVGSAARGLQTAHSDVDAVIYWREIPSGVQRSSVIEQANGIVHEIGDSSEGETDLALQSQAEVFYLLGDRMTGVKVDVTHKTVNSAESLIQSVVEMHDTKRIKLAIIHGMQHGLSLYGEEWMNHQLETISDKMPLPITEKLLAEHSQLKPTWIYDMFADRPDPILDQTLRLEHIDHMLMMLAAVNRVYMPYQFKHLSAFIAGLEHRPEAVYRDFEKILNSDPLTAKPIIVRLGDAVYDLVERHYPQLNIQDAREWFHYARPKHETSPLETINNDNKQQKHQQPE